MNPGKLDRRIILQRRHLSKDGTGSPVESWADEAKLWAEYVVHRGRESVVADADRAQDAQQFRIRHRAIDPANHRILYRSKFYNIQSATEEGGRRNTLLLDTLAIHAIHA
jgi:SPP1 family predicted phage head-tail adaptor